jgi:hypothetical protein
VRRAALREAVHAALGRPDDRPVTAADPGHGCADTRPLRILVAEDNPVNQRATTLMLGRLGPDGPARAAPGRPGRTRLARLHLPGDRPRIVALTAGATDEKRPNPPAILEDPWRHSTSDLPRSRRYPV